MSYILRELLFIVYFAFFAFILLIFRELGVNNSFTLLFYCLRLKFFLLIIRQLVIK